MKTPFGRRTFLKSSLGAVGAAIGLNSFEERVLAAEAPAPRGAADPAANVAALASPTGRIKHLEISRIICGGNLIGGWAHSRDLIYVSPLVKAYHTDEKVFETLRLAEKRGVNTVLTNPVSDRVINDYWYHQGGKIQWISDCGGGSTDLVRRSVDAGAHAVYLQGGVCDKLVRDGKLGEVEALLSFMRTQNVPYGLGAHSLETVKRLVAASLIPDFWVKTLHQDNYWSATPTANRAPYDEINGNKPAHDQPHDNMWCNNPKETIAYMATLKQPWIAFKVLAAGAIHPRHAFQWAFEQGADFLCVGMFDFQVVENTTLAAQALAAITGKPRARAWMA